MEIVDHQEGYLSRFCLLQTHLTHSYLLKNEDVPRHMACDCKRTLEHILIKCGDLWKLDKDIMMLRIYNNHSRKSLLHT